MNDSKEHIITIASKLFLQKSFKEVTMKEIVKETGLSKGAFYHYFESKEQLFFEVLDYFFTNVMTHAYEKYSRESFYKFYHDYANSISMYSQKYLDLFGENKTEEEFNMNYFSLAFDAIKLFPAFRQQMIDSQKKEIETWIEVLKKARETGEIKSTMTDEEIAKSFIFLGDGAAMHLIMRGVKIKELVSPFLTLWDKLYEQIKV